MALDSLFIRPATASTILSLVILCRITFIDASFVDASLVDASHLLTLRDASQFIWLVRARDSLFIRPSPPRQYWRVIGWRYLNASNCSTNDLKASFVDASLVLTRHLLTYPICWRVICTDAIGKSIYSAVTARQYWRVIDGGNVLNLCSQGIDSCRHARQHNYIRAWIHTCVCVYIAIVGIYVLCRYIYIYIYIYTDVYKLIYLVLRCHG